MAKGKCFLCGKPVRKGQASKLVSMFPGLPRDLLVHLRCFRLRP